VHNIYVGSQPIYNKSLEIYAYHLLFRNNDINKAQFSNEDQATSEVILNTLTNIGLDKIVGSHKASINFTRKFIIGEYPIPNMKDKIMVEIDRSTNLDDLMIENLNILGDKGYTLIMHKPHYQQYTQTKSDSEHEIIIKFDIKTYSRFELQQILFSPKENNISYLASKIETREEFDYCNSLDFEYYEGFFICEPNIIKRKEIPSSKAHVIQILRKLYDEKYNIKEIETLISTDVSFSYRILRYANSSLLGLSTRIDSIQHAILMLGWNSVRMIATLLILTKMEDCPLEVIYFGVLRAKMCENLAAQKNLDKNMAFAAGLFSIIDTLLSIKIEDILALIPLNETLIAALLDGETELGKLLFDTKSYISHQPELATKSKLSRATLGDAYIHALQWTNESIPILSEQE